MRLPDRLLFSFLPLNDSTEAGLQLVRGYAADHAAARPVTLRLDEDLHRLLSARDEDPHSERMQALSAIYRRAEMYNWLAWRFRETFVHATAAQQVKLRCVEEMKRMAS
ncbi:hypothetical protein STCU_11694 [Strigomonas culicis]|uniref:ATP-dependent RNA helicase SUV3 C-terminal domain-containing protein n=1 Tax=Strigomonas culicis TaxID=28005 RepID=S9TG02_9TRYP|nr:hypothetical protein STCU_11694 [Strigomonas culicis]|eukprot:EPY15889.1 hypothetical protein STCU_11694 [Strigomonas culicis]